MIYHYLVFFIVLLALDVVVYGFGSAMHSLRRDDTDEDDAGDQSGEKERARKSRELVSKILSDQSDYVDAVLTITAMINAVYGAVFGLSIGKALCTNLFHIPWGIPENLMQGLGVVGSLVIAWICVFYIAEVFGVQVPKRLAAGNPERWCIRCGRVVIVLLIILKPLLHLISLSAKGILYLCGVRGENLGGDVTEEEIRSIVHEGRQLGVLDQSESEMISNIFEFNDKEANEIMTHRNDIIAIDASKPLQEAVTYMLGERNSRFPVYEENIDNIKGIVHMRDAVKYKEDHPEDVSRPLGDLPDVVREAVFVPETKNIDDLFRQMQAQKTQMVIVIDEYGQTSGIVAMEDILEEIVGNILDEYDVDENHIQPTSNKNEFIIDGRTPLEDLEDRFELKFDDDRFETLNGFIMSRMDRVPTPNDRFTCEFGGFRFRILSVSDRQVQRVLLTRL